MKIGIMGGTFNPIHSGHLMLGEAAYREYDLDEVWFLPNGNPPHKNTMSLKNDTKERCDMVNLAIKDTPYFKLCDHEVKRKEISYSYETMEALKEKYPDHEFYFIIGADSLFSLEHWKHPERLLKVVTILAAYRDDKNTPEEMNVQIDALNQRFNSDIRLLQTPLLSVSSREIRRRAAIGDFEGIKELPLPREVSDYIIEKGLYWEE